MTKKLTFSCREVAPRAEGVGVIQLAARRSHLVGNGATEVGRTLGRETRWLYRWGLLLMALSVAFCGCRRSGPLRRQAYAAPIYDSRTIDALQLAYTNWTLTASNVMSDARPRVARNRVIYDLLRLSDHHYERFKAKLYVGEAGGNSSIDLASIGLTTAAGAVGGGTGQILSLADTALKGAQGKLMERWLNNKAMRVVVLAMDASRAEIRAQIYQGMKQDESEFPIEEGMELVSRYHAAASLPNALTYLEATMGDKNREAEAKAVVATTTNQVAQ